MFSFILFGLLYLNSSVKINAEIRDISIQSIEIPETPRFLTEPFPEFLLQQMCSIFVLKHTN